jgi:N-acetylmuramoyl-L-alanine amidase
MTIEWVPHVVRSGEHASGLAYARGTTVADVWAHPKNAELRKKRSNPDVLAPGDVIWLPEKPDPKWRPVQVGSSNKFVASVPKQTVKVKICGDDGKPLAGATYKVDDGGAVAPPAQTDGDGTATFDVAVHTRSVVLRLPDHKLAIPVHVGGLDPLSEVSGAIGRLRNLGYCHQHEMATEGGRLAEYVRFAVAWFQRDQGLSVTGEVDGPTRDKLGELGGTDGDWSGE